MLILIFEAFNQNKFNIFLTHEPHSIINLSLENNKCIQLYTDLVVSGHMHNGLLPNFLHPYCGTKGIISPQMELFPEYAQGEVKVGDTDFIINGPVNARIETPLINRIYGPSATIITLRKTLKNR